MLSNFELNLWLLALFFMMFGVLLLYVSRKTSPNEKLYVSRKTSPNEKEGGIGVRVFCFLFSLIFFAFSQYAIYAAIVYNVELGGTPPCENLINTSTQNGNTYTYTYTSSCTGIAPDAQVSFQVAYGWLLWIELIVLGIGSLFVFFGRVVKRW